MTKISNHFNLSNPLEWRCSVHTIDNQGTLRLKLYKPRVETLWIVFKAVIYFEGSLLWQGAHFHLAGPEESLDTIRSLRNESFRSMSDDQVLDKYSLFVVSIDPHSFPPRHVRIIAEGANVVLGKKLK